MSPAVGGGTAAEVAAILDGGEPVPTRLRERDGVDDAGGGRRGLRPELSPQLLAGLCHRFGIDPAASVVDLGGSAHLNLLVHDGRYHYVARVYRMSVTPARLDAVQAARRVLLDAGIPAAAIVPSRDGRPWIELDGRLAELERYTESDGPMNTSSRLRQGLPLLGAIHSVLADVGIPADGRDPLFANYVHPLASSRAAQRGIVRIRSWAPTVDEQRVADMGDELAAGLDLAPVNDLPRQLVHGDFWDNNVLFSGDRIVLVADLDFMGERARIDDLALTLFFSALEPGIGIAPDRAGAARVRRLVDAYDVGLEHPLTAAERAALPCALARQPLWSLGVWVADLDDVTTARRHCRALVPGLVWGLAIARDLEGWRDAMA